MAHVVAQRSPEHDVDHREPELRVVGSRPRTRTDLHVRAMVP